MNKLLGILAAVVSALLWCLYIGIFVKVLFILGIFIILYILIYYQETILNINITKVLDYKEQLDRNGFSDIGNLLYALFFSYQCCENMVKTLQKELREIDMLLDDERINLIITAQDKIREMVEEINKFKLNRSD